MTQAQAGPPTVALSSGYTHLWDDESSSAAAWSSGVHLGLGLGDTWRLRLLLNHAWPPANPGRRALHAGPDLLYVLDTLRWRPLLGLGTGLMARWHKDRSSQHDIAVHALVGVDHDFNPRWRLAFETRVLFLPTGDGRDLLDPAALQALISLAYRWQR
ncbi:MAG: hypothetical protein ACPGUV_04570 [Polyangiales bacterium]